MNKLFPDEMKNVEKGICPFCEKPVKEEDFKNEISKREFELSGMCQKCQDNLFD